METDYEAKYDTFISYPRSGIAPNIAKEIKKYLESYRIPKSAAREEHIEYQLKVFFDDANLPYGSMLPRIDRVLSNSLYLIVVCTEKTPDSKWIKEEIQTFIKYHGADRIIPVLLKGTEKTSFPRILKDVLNPTDDNQVNSSLFEKYKIVDLRADSLKKSKNILKREYVTIAAQILGYDPGDLRNERVRALKRKKRNRVIFTIIAAFLLAAASFATVVEISRQRQIQSLSDKTSPLLASLISFLAHVDMPNEANIEEKTYEDANWSSYWQIDEQEYVAELKRLYEDNQVTLSRYLAAKALMGLECMHFKDTKGSQATYLLVRDKFTKNISSYTFEFRKPQRTWLDNSYSAWENINISSVSFGVRISQAYISNKEDESYPLMGIRYETPFGRFTTYYADEQILSEPFHRRSLRYRTTVVDRHIDMSHFASLRGDWNLPSALIVPAGTEINFKPKVVQFKTEFYKIEISNIVRAAKFIQKEDTTRIDSNDYEILKQKTRKYVQNHWPPAYFEYLKDIFVFREGRLANAGVRPTYYIREDEVEEDKIQKLIESATVSTQNGDRNIFEYSKAGTADFIVHWQLHGSLLQRDSTHPGGNELFGYELDNPLSCTLHAEKEGDYWISAKLYSKRLGMNCGEVRWRILALQKEKYKQIFSDRLFEIKQVQNKPQFRIKDKKSGEFSGYIRDWRIEVVVDNRRMPIAGEGLISLDLDKIGIIPKGERPISIAISYYDYANHSWISDTIFQGSAMFQ